MDFLQGLTILDLASVGPAARASRILADYGMNVIKVAPVAAKGAKQIDPVFHAYGAGRGMKKFVSTSNQSRAGKLSTNWPQRLMSLWRVTGRVLPADWAWVMTILLRSIPPSFTVPPVAMVRTVPTPSGRVTILTIWPWPAFWPAAAGMAKAGRPSPVPRLP